MSRTNDNDNSCALSLVPSDIVSVIEVIVVVVVVVMTTTTMMMVITSLLF
jgi:hypothetical protein